MGKPVWPLMRPRRLISEQWFGANRALIVTFRRRIASKNTCHWR